MSPDIQLKEALLYAQHLKWALSAFVAAVVFAACFHLFEHYLLVRHRNRLFLASSASAITAIILLWRL